MSDNNRTLGGRLGEFADSPVILSHSSFWLLLYPLSAPHSVNCRKVKLYVLGSLEDKLKEE